MTLHAPVDRGTYTQAARTSRLAVASLVLGILGIHGVLGIISFFRGGISFLPSIREFSFPLSGLTDVVGPILALIVGCMATDRIGRSGGTLCGRGLAIAGIALGWIVVGTFVLLVIVFAIQVVSSGQPLFPGN